MICHQIDLYKSNGKCPLGCDPGADEHVMKAPGDEVGGYAVADSGEGPGVPLIYRPN